MIDAAALAAELGLPSPTEEQATVIQAPLEPALVVAGAGSGKTETMAARVVYLVANALAAPESILGLTFTRKAAGQLATRIRRRLRALAATGLIGDQVRQAVLAAEPEVSTYHAFAGRLIGEFGPLVGVEPGARVLTTTAGWQLARRIVTRWDGDLDTDLTPDVVTDRLLGITGALADHLVTPAQLSLALETILHTLQTAPPSAKQKNPVHSGLTGPIRQLRDRAWITPLVDALAEAKRRAGAVDFADQMQLAARLVAEHPAIAAALRDRYRVVLLDEYQDTGHAQRVILTGVFGAAGGARGHPVTAVGDPVQSIYSWRGASASNLRGFATDFPRADGGPAPVMPLLTSFRNPGVVLRVANAISAPIRTAPVPVGELRPSPGAPDGLARYGLFDHEPAENDWLADAIAGYWSAAAVLGQPGPSTAVLLRRRRDMAAVAAALRDRGLPVEVAGVGGLLTEPEVADLVATLRVLVDPAAGAAAIRLLTGARWRLGTADLAALARRARFFTDRAGADAGPGDGPADPRSVVRGALDGAAPIEDGVGGLVDALSDPGPAVNYSELGYRRLQSLAAELTRLRRGLGQPLPDLVADIEHAIGLDVQVHLASGHGRAHLDAFADVVADVASTGAGPAELLDYLDAALKREDGLEPGEVAPTPGAVQVLTVHAAKGLEFAIVAVPNISGGVFPSENGSTWLGDAGQLPPALRGDAADVPALRLPDGMDQAELAAALKAHTGELATARLTEERRLLYVALTRAERILLVSGHRWGEGVKPRPASSFLTEIAACLGDVGGPDEWAAAPEPGAANPVTAHPRTASWPFDPLGGRRTAIAAGADRVLAAIAGQAPPTCPADDGGDAPADDPWGWRRDVDSLLAERFAGRRVDVPLPQDVSVSTMVELARDPQQLARRLRRPLPAEPAPQARRGTAFHRWLEHYYGGEALLDLDDLPGAGDAGAGADEQVGALKAAFLASRWATRVPVAIEVPFVTQLAGLGMRGRIDAVFADPDGGLTVVDWKTGGLPVPALRAALAVQLACYRLAAAALWRVPLGNVRAAFHYVAAGETVAPVDLLNADGLAALVAGSTHAGPSAAVPQGGSAMG